MAPYVFDFVSKQMQTLIFNCFKVLIVVARNSLYWYQVLLSYSQTQNLFDLFTCHIFFTQFCTVIKDYVFSPILISIALALDLVYLFLCFFFKYDFPLLNIVFNLVMFLLYAIMFHL